MLISLETVFRRRSRFCGKTRMANSRTNAAEKIGETFFSAFSPHMGADFLAKLHGKPGEKGEIPWRKFAKSTGETPLSLVVVERVLTYFEQLLAFKLKQFAQNPLCEKFPLTLSGHGHPHRTRAFFFCRISKLGNGRNTVSRVPFRRRELTEPH